ncbi:hypothetical protein EG68_10700 [Paragonimus skrjabini miyazakii]|uniref:EF-hand domain-containing protein n=1 Tax=Paragonimus skrjabini miyazakii TaxID=59628 RepID=A0A8S9YIG2_9TREM|nr:hypothetical protein EG68_10700 [Paragonimus skrjabini miyazakii]
MNDAEIEQMFYHIDKNHSGKISFRELKAFFKNSSTTTKSKDIKCYMKQLDLNGDGKITLEELKAGLGRKV